MITGLICAPTNTTGCGEPTEKGVSILAYCPRKVSCGNMSVDFFK